MARAPVVRSVAIEARMRSFFLKSGRWEPAGNGQIRIDPPHVENTNQQVHAPCQCKTRKAEVVVNKVGISEVRGVASLNSREKKKSLREQGFNL